MIATQSQFIRRRAMLDASGGGGGGGGSSPAPASASALARSDHLGEPAAPDCN